MLAHHVARAQGRDADLLAGPLGQLVVPIVDRGLGQIAPERLGHHLGHAQRGPAGSVLLEAMVGLHDLHVVVVAQHPRHVREDAEGHVDAHAHVGRDEDRGAAADAGELLALRGGEPGGADHRAPALPRGQPRVGQARLRHRELDEDAILAERRFRVGGDRDGEPAYPRDLPRVASERRVPGRLEGGHQPQLLVLLEQRDQTVAHPAGGAGDDDIRHDGRRISP